VVPLSVQTRVTPKTVKFKGRIIQIICQSIPGTLLSFVLVIMVTLCSTITELPDVLVIAAQPACVLMHNVEGQVDPGTSR